MNGALAAAPQQPSGIKAPSGIGLSPSTATATVPAATAAPTTTTQVFCCQRCRCVLFTEEQLSAQHEEGKHRFARRKMGGGNSGGGRITECSSKFVSEPNTWMEQVTAAEKVGGKLHCPKCAHRVGSFAWSGSQCSCGTWIVPAFQFPLSRVDHRKCQTELLPQHVHSPATSTPTQEPEPAAPVEAKRDVREARHEEWFRLTNGGDCDAVTAMLDHAECSLTTVQKRIFDGVAATGGALGKSCSKLAGRLRLVDGPTVLAPPSLMSRIRFTVEGIEDVQFGETIVWDTLAQDAEPKVQHVMRTKNPGEGFMPPPVK